MWTRPEVNDMTVMLDEGSNTAGLTWDSGSVQGDDHRVYKTE